MASVVVRYPDLFVYVNVVQSHGEIVRRRYLPKIDLLDALWDFGSLHKQYWLTKKAPHVRFRTLALATAFQLEYGEHLASVIAAEKARWREIILI